MVGRDRSAAVASTAYFGIAGERGLLGYGLSVALGLAVAFVVWPHVHGTPQKMVSAGDVAASSSGSADAARAIPAFASFSNVTVAYYDIDATDAAAIKEQLGERGPHLHDAQFEGLTNWYYRWHWDPAPTGGCGAANANVSVEAHVVLPRLARIHSVTPRVARAWRSYMDALTRHVELLMRTVMLLPTRFGRPAAPRRMQPESALYNPFEQRRRNMTM